MRKSTQSQWPQMDRFFLSERLRESRLIVKQVAAASPLYPLIIQFSGGRDSMAMLGLVREVTDRYVCAYMATGLEFKGVIQFVKETCAKLGAPLIISQPGLHKGNIFQRIEQFRDFPHLIGTWCCRDLKLRPEKKLLRRLYGHDAVLYKLEGIRLSESSRRKRLYKDVTDSMIRPDGEMVRAFEVFPILHWTDSDVTQYLKMKRLPTSGLYNEFGVSGCAWCPFYQPDIYRRILAKLPNHYDRFIEWENTLNKPRVSGYIYLRDIKREVLEGVPLPESAKTAQAKTPCMVEFEGKMVKTCDVYGHLFIDGKCFRCDEPMPVPEVV